MNNKFSRMIFDNIVTIIFVVLCLAGIVASKLPLFFIGSQLLTRIGRNSFLVLSLIIPVLAGMGLNFGIVVGAMAGQMSIILVTNYALKGVEACTGLTGFLIAVVVSTPIAILFGWVTGLILNKTKGQEMITSMMLGFFANGLYQLLFLFLVGTLIPMENPVLMISGGVGIKNVVDMNHSIRYAVDNVYKGSFTELLIIMGVMGILLSLWIMKKSKESKVYEEKVGNKPFVYMGVSALFIGLSIYFKSTGSLFANIRIPISTYGVIVGLCVFNVLIIKTKLGQDFRTVGQSRHIAGVAGINVDKVRIISIIISTVLAAWGQLIFLQNLGILNTYGSHEQAGMFAVAALLVGGASVSRATIGQAILGVTLFHTLFIVSPQAGKNLFGNAQIGEYFRTFVAYGVIGVSLGLHAWKNMVISKRKSI
ncbi:MAG: ABC transporter permease [Anaeromicrobium sp.]|uniref:ABC transporter permease subunit n=1 Tax=Anaeromicrobium sp. TaxID=1929132 RepID=UPI0025DE9B62|nr:ABC transporter permease [Anaeromicrobium sp.]MCT4593079.1 ABC transporter permease [Anaeromicrobium sp.]